MATGQTYKIGFLGAGKMATALALGWHRAGLIGPGQCLACDPVEKARAQFTQATGFDCLAEASKVIQQSEIVVLAVKPQSLRDLLELTCSDLTSKKLVLSIIAGASLDRLHNALGHTRIVRIMPNTPCRVGESATAYCLGSGTTAEDSALVSRLFNSVGRAFPLPESLMDAVTGLSGSGPAFVFLIIEALADGGVRAGLSREVAQVLAAQTVMGAAKMVLETGVHPGQLKDEVASPAGTTIAGLFELEQSSIRGALMRAVEAAAKRSAELGKQ